MKHWALLEDQNTAQRSFFASLLRIACVEPICMLRNLAIFVFKRTTSSIQQCLEGTAKKLFELSSSAKRFESNMDPTFNLGQRT